VSATCYASAIQTVYSRKSMSTGRFWKHGRSKEVEAITESVPLDEVFEMLGRIRQQVHVRLADLCEPDYAYLNPDHVKFQREQLDSVLDQEAFMIANTTSSWRWLLRNLRFFWQEEHRQPYWRSLSHIQRQVLTADGDARSVQPDPVAGSGSSWRKSGATDSGVLFDHTITSHAVQKHPQRSVLDDTDAWLVIESTLS